MQTLKVELEERSYPIQIGVGLLSRADLILPYLKTQKAVVVTNTTVAPLYLDRMMTTLVECGVAALSIILPDGE